MKTFLTILSSLHFVIFSVLAQNEPEPSPSAAAGDYEVLPQLSASEILNPAILDGPNYKIRDEVSTYSGANHFMIDSQFGIFEAEGNEMLVRRVAEINAIAKLREVSRTDEFKDALKKAAISPLKSAKAIVTDPVTAITNVPKGISKFMGRIGNTVKGIGKKEEGNDSEGAKAKQIIGYSEEKRKEAIKLGVDPYSTNQVLQKELDEIAWASFAGGAAFTLATLPIGGAAGAALTVTNVSGEFEQMLTEKTPADLKAINRKTLIGMGAGDKEADSFLRNNAFSPSAQTAFVLNLRSMKDVANRRAFVRLAAENSSSEADAIFCVQTSSLLSKLHNGGTPLARIETLGDFPIAVAKDGTTIVALQWDYAAWTVGAAQFTGAVQNFAAQSPRNKKVLVALSGQMTPRLRQELEARGQEVRDRVAPGPLK